MAVEMLWNASLVFNSVDLSSRVRSLVLTRNHEDLESTAMGAVARGHFPGLRDDSAAVVLYQDFAAANVEATIGAALGNGTGFTTVIKKDTAATSATNPSYTATTSPFTHTPINGEVGEMHMTDVTFLPVLGSSFTKAVA